MKAFEGKWSVSPCEMSQPLAAILAERDAKDVSEVQHWSKRLSGSQSGVRPLPPWAHATALANNFKGKQRGRTGKTGFIIVVDYMLHNHPGLCASNCVDGVC